MVETMYLKKGTDVIEIQILDNGDIKILTPGAITPEHHASADNLIEAFASNGFELTSVESRGHKHTHQHHHHHHEHKEGE